MPAEDRSGPADAGGHQRPRSRRHSGRHRPPWRRKKRLVTQAIYLAFVVVASLLTGYLLSR